MQSSIYRALSPIHVSNLSASNAGIPQAIHRMWSYSRADCSQIIQELFSS